jgi:hypothetical protein
MRWTYSDRVRTTVEGFHRVCEWMLLCNPPTVVRTHSVPSDDLASGADGVGHVGL